MLNTTLVKMRKIPKTSGNRRVAVALAAAFAIAAAGAAWFQYAGSREGPGPNDARVFIDTRDAELVALGRTVYADNCAGCHGAGLEGAPNWRTRNDDGVLPAPPHDETGHTWHHPDGMLLDITRLGGQRFMPAGFQSGMPAFGGALLEREIIASLAFIKSSWPEKILARQKNITGQAQ